MKREEKDLLILQKIREGKISEQAEEEVERDIIFLREFKDKKKEAEKEIKRLEKEKEKISKKFKKEFEKLQKELNKEVKKEKQNKNSNEYQKQATVKNLSRIIKTLKSEGKMNMKQICDFCMLSKEKVKESLIFLTNNKIIKKEKNLYVTKN